MLSAEVVLLFSLTISSTASRIRSLMFRPSSWWLGLRRRLLTQSGVPITIWDVHVCPSAIFQPSCARIRMDSMPPLKSIETTPSDESTCGTPTKDLKYSYILRTRAGVDASTITWGRCCRVSTSDKVASTKQPVLPDPVLAWAMRF